MNWKPYVLPIACACGGLVAGGFAGRYLTPVKTVERVVEKEKVVIDEDAISRAVRTAKAEWDKTVKDRTVTKVIYKDGKPIEKIVYVDRDTTSSGGSTSVETKVVEVEKKVYVDREVVKEKVVEGYRPWVGVEGAGAFSLTSAWPPVAWWVMGDIRVLGPLWVGAGVMRDDTWRPAAKVRLEF